MAKNLFENMKELLKKNGSKIKADELTGLTSLAQKEGTEIYEGIKESFEPVNILIAGKTGVGKSTLINSVFRDDLAKTGIGEPVTQYLEKYYKESIPIRLYDTKGLELASKSQEKVIEKIIDKVKTLYTQEKSEHVHAIWYVVNAQSRRIEEVELAFVRQLSELAPIIIVLSQYYGEADGPFLSYLDELSLPVYCVQPVLAANLVIDESHLLRSHGIEELVLLTEEILPEYTQQAFANAQKINIEMKVKQAQKIAERYTLTAAGVSATPLPFADATALMSIQAVMIMHLTAAFGISVSKSLVLGLSSSSLASQGAKLIGKYLSTSLGKFVPGGIVAATIVNSVIAKQITNGLAQSYIKVLEQVAQMEKTGQTVNESEFLAMTKAAFAKKEQTGESND